MFWNKTQLDELLKEHIEDLQDKKETFLKLLNSENEKGLKEMMARKYKKEIVEKRVGIRKSSSGRPQQLDQEDEEFILNCIESKSRAHGRRSDAVMYTNHRVKKKDFLKLANYSRLSRGLKPIKSATTVYNRARPGQKVSRPKSI